MGRAHWEVTGSTDVTTGFGFMGQPGNLCYWLRGGDRQTEEVIDLDGLDIKR